MADKKKAPMPAPKAPPAPAKQQTPPSGGPAQASVPSPFADGTASGAPAQDHSQVPVEAKDKPDRKTSDDAPVLATDKSTVTVPFDPIDWGSIMAPYRLRGAPLDNRDFAGVEQHWHWTYRSLVRLGFTPDLAITLTNAATPVAVDLALKRDFPTTEERFDQETERMLGPGKSLGKIMVPLNAPIEWAVGKLIRKPFKLEF